MPRPGYEVRSGSQSSLLKPQVAAAIAGCVAILGLFAIPGTVSALLEIWRTDPLKSVGLAVPPVCFLLILREWRSLAWRQQGTWWGFGLLAFLAVLMFFRSRTILTVVLGNGHELQIPPLPLIAVLYATAWVLLFGGKPLLRKAWFPVALMWAVIPVPSSFSSRIDLPLQHAGATVARHFAHLVGIQLSPGDLRIMFSPEVAIFIAPGCDGLRGAVTLGLTALVVAYVYRFRWIYFVPVALAGVALGYVFNFVRLCALIVYNRLSVTHPALRPHEQQADHVIGGCIFLFALFLFFTLVGKLRRDPEAGAAETNTGHAAAATPAVPALPLLARVSAVLLLAALFGVSFVRAQRTLNTIPTQFPALPSTVGAYRLTRTWEENDNNGHLVYLWGEYAPPAGAPVQKPVAFGVSALRDVHDAQICHFARGEEPAWQGQVNTATPTGTVPFAGVLYNNGVAQHLQFATVCDGATCGQYSRASRHFTILFSPRKGLPLASDNLRRVPLLLDVQADAASTPPEVARPQLVAAMQQFLAGANLAQLTAPYSHH